MAKTRRGPNIRDLIEEILREVMPLIADRFAAVGQPHPDSPLAQVFLADGDEVVLDYLDHNEAGIAFDHLLYMIDAVDIPITPDTYGRICQTGELLGLDAERSQRVNPGLDPIKSVVELHRAIEGSYSFSFKRLTGVRKSSIHQGPFCGDVLHWRPVSEGQEIFRAILGLEHAEQMRCHMPTYSIEFHSPTKPCVEVAPCFECNNARTRIGNSFGWFSFDGASPSAERLLAELKSIEATASGA